MTIYQTVVVVIVFFSTAYWVWRELKRMFGTNKKTLLVPIPLCSASYSISLPLEEPFVEDQDILTVERAVESCFCSKGAAVLHGPSGCDFSIHGRASRQEDGYIILCWVDDRAGRTVIVMPETVLLHLPLDTFAEQLARELEEYLTDQAFLSQTRQPTEEPKPTKAMARITGIFTPPPRW